MLLIGPSRFRGLLLVAGWDLISAWFCICMMLFVVGWLLFSIRPLVLLRVHGLRFYAFAVAKVLSAFSPYVFDSQTAFGSRLRFLLEGGIPRL